MAAKEKLNVSNEMLTSDNGFDLSLFEGLNDVLPEDRPNLSSIPVLKLIQALSPEARDRRAYPDIYPGVIIDDSTKEVLGGTEEDATGNNPKLLKVYVLKSWTSRVKFPPRNSGVTGIECSCPTYQPRATKMGEEDYGSTYGKCKICPYSSWGVKDGCRTQYNMLVCLASDPKRKFRILLSKTSYKAASAFEKDWLETAKPLRNKATGNYPPYFVLPVYVYGREEENKSKDHYYVFDLKVQPFEPGVMNKDLIKTLVDVKKDVEELYTESIKFHADQVAAYKEKMNADSPSSEASSPESQYSALENAFGSDERERDYSTSDVSEDLPF